MLRITTKLIRELISPKLKEEMSLNWWTSKRRNKIYHIITGLDYIKKNIDKENINNLNLEKLEKFLMKIKKRYSNKPNWSFLKECPDLDNTKNMNERIDDIISFLKLKSKYIDEFHIKDLEGHKEIQFSKQLAYQFAQLKFAKHIAKKAGGISLPFFNHNFDVEIKQDNSPVTDADKTIDNFIIDAISKKFPSHAILTEESEDDMSRLNKKHIWIVDPLDGTKQFISHKEGWGILIAKVTNKKPEIGVAYFPKEDLLFFAKKGKGAYVEHNKKVRRIHVSHRVKDLIILATSSPSQGSDFYNYLSSLPHTKIIGTGATGNTICRIAWGEGDYVAHNHGRKKEWDICAPHIILEEAGGKLTDLKGNNILYNNKSVFPVSNGMLASNGFVHNFILKFFK